MKIAIRQAIILLVLSLSTSIMGAEKVPAQTPVGGNGVGHSVTAIGEGVYVFRWRVYRNIFIVTDEGVIVTDPLNPKAAQLLQSEIRKITAQPVKYVVYSHHHHDHIAGGAIFKAEGARFVGHKNLLKELGDHPNPTIPAPDITFDDRYRLTLGGRNLELIYLGPNHGESLVVMRIPEEKLLFTVDIVTPRRVAFRTMPDFWPDEWIRSLKAIEQMDIDYVIPAHGAHNQPAVEAASVVTEQRAYLEDLMAAVKHAMESGTHSPDVLRKSVKLPKYQHWQYYDAWLPMNIERIWAYYHMGW